MNNNKLKDFKNILKMYMLIAIPAIILLVNFYNYAYKSEVEKTAEIMTIEQKKKAMMIKYVVEDMYKNVLNDLFVVGNSNEMKSYLNKTDDYTERELGRMFLRFISNKKSIDQIRFLDMKGMEIVRAQSYQGKVALTPRSELQDKSDRYYFNDSHRLKDGQVYISPMDLNIENGKIEIPHKPMIRFATPMYFENGELAGVLVINHMGEDFLDIFKEYFANDEEGLMEPMLVNSDGYYLFTKQEGKGFGFMFEEGREYSLQYENRELWEEVIKNESGVFEYGSERYYYSHIHPISNKNKNMVHNDNHWIILSSFDVSKITQIDERSFLNIKKTFFISLILISIFILIIVTVIYYSRKNKNQLELTKNISNSTSDAVIITDPNTNIIYANNAFEQYTGYSSKEVIGLKPSHFKSDKQDQDFYKNMWKEINEKGLWKGTLWDKKKSGMIYPKELTIIEVKDKASAKTINYIGIFKDLTNMKAMEKYVSRLKNYNLNTDLPNENLLADLIKSNIISDKSLFSIIYFSVDNYHKIISQFGKSQYRQLIIEMVNNIKGIIEKEDFIAQINASKFVVILKSKDNLDDIKKFMDEFVEKTKRAERLNGKDIYSDIKSGIAVYPNDGENSSELVLNANIALESLLKETGENYKFYKPEFKEIIKRESEMELLLSRAIANNELDIHYQPQIDVCQGKMVGAEALIRWKSEKLGHVSPAQFIPLAEKAGFMIEIGNWIIERVCRDLKSLKDLQCNTFKMSINISAVQFRDSDLLNYLTKVMQRYGVNPQSIEVEITETLFIENLESINKKLNEFRELGISVAIDDFGTGFSSLAYLKKLNIDKLKIDRSFIKDYPEHDNGEMAQVITEMAKKLNLKVITEGAETKEQVDYLKSIGCNMVQGYYYSKPLPKKKFKEFCKDSMAKFLS